MFRRTWAGLPADPEFPSDLKGLGYFVNEDDEIRSIENHENYFKFFISRNPRWNERQRYAMNEACQKVVHSRLKSLGLEKHTLPLGHKDVTQPHLPIFASKNMSSATRIVLIFGESTQDLGILAHRVLGGPGGVDKGSMVSIVQGILSQYASRIDNNPPAVLLANCGQLMWLPALRKTLTPTGWGSTRMKSAVHTGNLYNREVNSVPGNRTIEEHAQYIFESVLPSLLSSANSQTARIDVIGVGDGADAVEQYLDTDTGWRAWGHRLNCIALVGGMHPAWGHRLNCIALVGGMHPAWEVQNPDFRVFLRERCRNYALSMEPLGTILSGPDGNPKTTAFTSLGCPVLSSGEAANTECTLIEAGGMVLAWLQEVSEHTTTTTTATSASVMTTNTYKNPDFEVTYADPDHGLSGPDADDDWRGWEPFEEGGAGEVPLLQASLSAAILEDYGSAASGKTGVAQGLCEDVRVEVA
ncbi:Arb2 domain-domain-containing protein [Microdochium bolleyi]|uniref:Arb2 domain-domain-containing protein n=1 Tax=Microdochium bolleyi TaxID=196109 RepID=A0A136J9H4_9PEZI|nr:Arb2 domain-domain-containing protein [Microdochium bolleyi]